jgi:hypothetical protein
MSRTARPRIDREDELALLDRVARGETRARIALIQAEAGMGKSELIREFTTRNSKQELTCVLVDFRGGGLSLADILFHISDTCGWSKFPGLSTTVHQFAHPATVNVSGNIFIGQNEIAVALGGPDESSREMRRAEITSSFVRDLRAFKRITLIFDVFEKCDPVLQGWFASVFLPAVHRSTHIAVIIAGQSIPEQTQMWECEHLALEGIPAAYWQVYARSIGVALSLDYIEACCFALKGHCLSIAQTLEERAALARRGNQP